MSQILKELVTVSHIVPQAVTYSHIFCCYPGNVRHFPKEMLNFVWYENVWNSWHESFILVKNLVLLAAM